MPPHPSSAWTRTWFALPVLVAVSAAFRAWAAAQVPIPWIAPDELHYALIGRHWLRPEGRDGPLVRMSTGRGSISVRKAEGKLQETRL